MTEQRTKIDRVQKNHQQAGSSTTTIHTDPGVFCLPPQDLEAIRTYYNSILGPLNMAKAAVIERAIQAGVTASAILDALEQTALAPRPSHAYLTAILRRYMAEGITTAEEAEAQRFQRRHEREMARVEREHTWYMSPADELEFMIGGYQK